MLKLERFNKRAPSGRARSTAGLWKVRHLPFYLHRGERFSAAKHEWLIRDGGEPRELAYDACGLLLRADLRTVPFASRRAALAALEASLKLELEIFGEYHMLADGARAAGLTIPDRTAEEVVAGRDLLTELLTDLPAGQPSHPAVMQVAQAVICAAAARTAR